MVMVKNYPADDVRRKFKGMVVAVGGPPHSGKSVFLAELYRQLLARKASGVFLQRACPDGEGMWSAESDPQLVAEIRRKGTFSEEFISFILKGIENLGKVFEILLVDLGGKRTAENAEILRRSTHLIVLSSKEEEDKPWQEFAAAEGCETIAIFRTRLVKEDEEWHSWVDLTTQPIRGELINLDREGPKTPYQKTISQFADWLIG